jgi:hypothetical protein
MRLSDDPLRGLKGHDESSLPWDVVRVAEFAGQVFFWHPIDTVPAFHISAYGYPEPTMFDSTAVSDEYHYFQVIAHTNNNLVFYVSNPDSGRSVDNMAPAQPQNLVGHQLVSEIQLSWDPNPENDLAYYAVHRGLAPEFTPGPANMIGAPLDTALVDEEWRWDAGYLYKVCAIDIHGNVSPYALLDPDLVTGVSEGTPPSASYLAPNSPNPFASTTRIRFGLAEAGVATVRIYDVAGRLVRTLVEDAHPAGNHAAVWDGKNHRGNKVPGGVYFCRVEVGSFVQTRKMVVIR